MPETLTSLKYSEVLINYTANMCIKIYIDWGNMEEADEKHILSLWVIFTPAKGITAPITQFMLSDAKT